MSNYLAIATVTAALQHLLTENVTPNMSGVKITTQRPEAPSGDISGPSVNIYMYQATPNQAWRNKDIRTRRPKGDLIKHGLAALDLSYLFSFYGNEDNLEPQQLMGSTIRTLVDHPLLTPEMIRSGIAASGLAELEQATLEEQVQRVRFVPEAITTEELSRIWSTFVQVPYALSFAYQATAVLIQGEKSGKAALPVRRRMAAVTQNRPVIERIDPQNIEEPITLSSNITIRGRQLMGYDRTEIRIGTTRITPSQTQETQLLLQLSELNADSLAALRSGVQALQVIQVSAPMPGSVWEPTIESNVVPIVLCPTIVGGNAGISTENIRMDYDKDAYAGTVFVNLDLTVGPQQRAFLLLNRVSGEGGETYIFRTERRYEETNRLEFLMVGVDAGEFLIRVQIDGAESPLIDDGERYIGPLLSIS